YAFSSTIQAKEPRYFFFALPPLAFAATRFFTGRLRPPFAWSTDRARIIFLSLLVLTQAALARIHDVGHLPNYAFALAELANRPDAALVLVDAVRDGQFVVDAYQNPKTRNKIIPLRASKFLYVRAARERYQYQQFVQRPEDIVAFLDEYGIRYIVTE